MRNHTCFLKIAGLLISCLYAFSVCASAPAEADQIVKTLYHNLNPKKNRNITDRIVWFSGQFLHKPYLLGALGEGPEGHYDQYPLYRTDAFDCETYVDTVLALAMADNLSIFREKLLKIRYKKGKRAYIYRNHFTDLDWNRNNQQQGFIKDITPDFRQVKIAEAEINKPAWYAKRPPEAIRLLVPNPEESKKRLIALHNKGKLFSLQKVAIPYIPLTRLFDSQGKANAALFAKIPQGAIIEIVRPNWNLEKAIGTRLNVSHLGFAIWKNKQLYFRQASSQEHQVVDVLMEEYLGKALNSSTIKGINVQRVL